MTDERCRLFEDCLAPLCPLDRSSLKGIWYSDEEICRSRTNGNLPWVNHRPGTATPMNRPFRGRRKTMDEQTKISVRIGQTTPAPLKRFYRVDEVAVYFAISARTVYRLLDMGDLQATRIRGCLRVSSAEVQRFEALLATDGDIAQ